MQSACEVKQSTYERDAVRRLNYCVTVTDRIYLCNNNNEFRVEKLSLRSYYYLYVYVLCVCMRFTCIILTSKFKPVKIFCNCCLTKKKHFADNLEVHHNRSVYIPISLSRA